MSRENKQTFSGFTYKQQKRTPQHGNTSSPATGINVFNKSAQKQEQMRKNQMQGFMESNNTAKTNQSNQQPMKNSFFNQTLSGSNEEKNNQAPLKQLLFQNQNQNQQKQSQWKKVIPTQFSKDYKPQSVYDIINDYYLMCEGQSNPDLLKKISQIVRKLFTKQRPQTNITKINFPQLAGIPQPTLTQIKNFWLSITRQFINHQPYCSFEEVINLIQFHIKQNYHIYYPNKKFNIKLFQQNNILGTTFDQRSSSFCINLIKTLSQMPAIFVNQFCSIILIVPDNLAPSLYNQEIVKNIFQVIKNIYNMDVIVEGENHTRNKICLDLVNALLYMHSKFATIFSKQFVNQFVRFLDSHLHIISRNYRVDLADKKDKDLSISLGSKIIKLTNLLLFKFPFNQQKTNWDQQIKKTIFLIKSRNLTPFKWLLNDKLQQGIGSLNQFAQNYLMEKNQQRQNSLYFPIFGSQWLLLLKSLLKHQNKFLSINGYYNDIIFYLICSIIQESTLNFWTDSQQFQPIYAKISNMYKNIQLNPQNSPQHIQQLGKLSRIMLCACGIKKPTQKTLYSKQFLSKIQSDSIMLNIPKNQQQLNSIKFSNLVFNSFITNIMGMRGLSKQKLFGQIIIKHLIQQISEEIPIFGFEDQILKRYHYQYPIVVIYQLIIRIMLQNDHLMLVILSLWIKQAQKQKIYSQNQALQQICKKFIWKFTFQYLLKIQQNCFTYSPTQKRQTMQNLQVLPQILELLLKFIKNQDTQQMTLSLLNDQKLVLSNIDLNQILVKCMYFQNNIIALTKHVQQLYQLKFKNIRWVKQICASLIFNQLTKWQEIIARHYANITRIAVYQNCFARKKQKIQQYNYLVNQDKNQFYFTQQNKVNQQMYDIVIPELKRYADYVLEFIIWALKIEQDSYQEEYFYNCLCVGNKYQTLQAALKLLEVLILVYIRFQDRVYLPEKLRRFLSVCQKPNQLSANSQSSFTTKLTSTPQIPLSNKKIATLPACLVYLISQPLLSQQIQQKQLQPTKAVQVRSIALNILNMILVNSTSDFSLLSAVEGNAHLLQDGISYIDFNLYEQFFMNQFRKVYCSAKNIFIKYIRTQIHQRNPIKILTPQKWYQNSYNYGQMIDTLTQVNQLFRDRQIRQAVEIRIKIQLQNNQKLTKQMRRVLSRYNFNQSLYGIKKSTIPVHLSNYLSDRQISAYSRYLLWITSTHQSQNKDQQDHILKIMELLISKIQLIIKQNPQSTSTLSIISQISINIWKSIRLSQTKLTFNLFVRLLKKYLPFIMSTHHMQINDKQYIKQYIVCMRLIFACKQYLPANLYSVLKGGIKDNMLLIKLLRNLAENVSYYTVLLSGLQFLRDLIQKTQQNQFKIQLQSLYKIVNQTINPALIQQTNLYQSLSQNRKQNISSSSYLPVKKQKRTNKRQLDQLSKDITVIAIIMFFNINIGRQINASLGEMLLYADNSTQGGFKSQALLFNIQNNTCYNAIETAIKIINNSYHYLQFVSICNYFYRTLSSLHTCQLSNINIQHILQFINYILQIPMVSSKKQKKRNQNNQLFMKSWVCNLLYVLINNCQKNTLLNISQLILTKIHLHSLLGQLLTIFGQVQIKWSYNTQRVIYTSQLSLLQKQLLLSLLKIYTSLIAKNQQCINKNGDNKNSIYLNLCKNFVTGSKIFNKRSNTVFNDQSRGWSSAIPTSKAKNHYEDTLQKISLEYLYGANVIANSANTVSNRNTTYQQTSCMQPSKLQIIHPECSNSLDLGHDHLNLLITQQYLMILLGCYKNRYLILDSYEFNQIITIFQNVSRRLQEIYAYSKPYSQTLKKFDAKIWSTYKMNMNLYYLNLLEQSPKEQLETINNIAQLCIHCILLIKKSLQMHKDYRQFYIRVDKIFKQAKKNHQIYKFQIKDYIENSGFQSKSQYGGSFMTPSAHRYTF